MITSFVASELTKLQDFEPSMQAKVNWDIISLVNSFKSQGQLNEQNNTGRYMVEVLSRLLAWKPVSPLTGEDAEWQFNPERSNEELHVFTNMRCPSVCKEVTISTNDVKHVDYEAVMISSDGGVTWWEREKNFANIQFPYMPPTVPTILYVKEKEGCPEEYEIVNDEKEIEAMRSQKLQEMEKIQRQLQEAVKDLPLTDEEGDEDPSMSNPEVIEDAAIEEETSRESEEAAIELDGDTESNVDESESE